MAKFFYRMQNILDIKLKLETQAKNEFAIANAKLAEEEEKLELLENRKEAYEAELKVLYSSQLHIKEITETQQAVEIMKYQIKLQQLQVRKKQKNVEAARMKLQESMQERKTHDKLKEKEFEQLLMDEAARESKEIDELVSYRHGQKKEE